MEIDEHSVLPVGWNVQRRHYLYRHSRNRALLHIDGIVLAHRLATMRLPCVGHGAVFCSLVRSFRVEHRLGYDLLRFPTDRVRHRNHAGDVGCSVIVDEAGVALRGRAVCGSLGGHGGSRKQRQCYEWRFVEQATPPGSEGGM